MTTQAVSDPHADDAIHRASRRSRIRGRNVRLRERDVDILLALAKMRLLRTSDLTALYFQASGTAQKRLRKLFDTGLVRAVVTDLAAENRYALTAVGHAFLVEAADGAEVPPFRPAPRVDRRSVAHLDLLNQYRIALARGCAAPGVELRSFTPEWELRAAEPRAELMPDAGVVLARGARKITIALEIDVGTEPPRLVVKKIERYQAAAVMRRAVCGLVNPMPLLVVMTARRARSLARAIGEAGGGGVHVGAAPFVLQDGGLGTGLALVRQLVAADGPLDGAHFSGSLLALLRR
jgi:hypothetical protein